MGLSGQISYAQELTLSGIFHRPERTSSAVFILPDKRQKLVAEGRLITPGVELLDVAPQAVRIRDNGVERWLSFTASKGVEQKTAISPKVAASVTKLRSEDNPVYRQRLLKLRSSLERQSTGSTRGYLVKDEGVFALLGGGVLARGDIIKTINGNSFSRSDDLEELAYSWRPNATYEYTVVRGGEEITLPR